MLKLVKVLGVGLLGVGVLGLWAYAEQSEHFQMRSVVASSGNTYTGSGKQIRDSAGEPVVGQSFGGKYSVQAGYFSDYFLPAPTATTTPTLLPTATMVAPKTYLKVMHNQINPNRGEQALVRWTQPQSAPITITIYNMVGEKIVTLVNSQTYQANEFQEVKWDGRNSKGEAVGSGIYIVHLKTAGFESHYKIAVIK